MIQLELCTTVPKVIHSEIPTHDPLVYLRKPLSHTYSKAPPQLDPAPAVQPKQCLPV